MRNLRDKVVIVPGASGGMGKAICHLLAKEGAKLAIASNDATELKDLETSLRVEGAEVVSMILDVTVETDVVSFYEQVTNAFGNKVDILLNLTGISTPFQIAEMPVEKYDLTIDVNLKGTFLFTKHFIPLVDTAEGAQIINIGSMAANRPNAANPMYSAAKSAVNMFSKSLALQLIDKKIRVSTLNPGPTDTPFWGDRQIPREKFMQATDIAEVLLFLLKFNPAIVIHEIDLDSLAFFK